MANETGQDDPLVAWWIGLVIIVAASPVPQFEICAAGRNQIPRCTGSAPMLIAQARLRLDTNRRSDA
ncbi:MAG TPA: hypothetical protein VK001_12190 [Geminicoccaceae bacterium]|nr:hypothetical protein [Geminicoccaceae bacterium]